MANVAGLQVCFSTRSRVRAAKVQSQARSRRALRDSSILVSAAHFMHARANCRYSLDVIMAGVVSAESPRPVRANLQDSPRLSEMEHFVRCFARRALLCAPQKNVPILCSWPRVMPMRTTCGTYSNPRSGTAWDTPSYSEVVVLRLWVQTKRATLKNPDQFGFDRASAARIGSNGPYLCCSTLKLSR